MQDPADIERVFESDALALLLESTPAPMMVVDGGLRLRAWNRAAQDQLGRRRGEAIGHACISLVPSLECIGGCPLLRGDTDGLATIVMKDGSHRYFQRTGRVVTNRHGEVLGIVERLMPWHGAPSSGATVFDAISTRSPEMSAAIHAAKRAARVPVHVLVTGEAGTGKSMFAHALHAASGSRRPLLTVACGTAGPTDWADLLARASGGALLLEHLQELSAADQRVLSRIWPEPSVVRVIATARSGLEQLAAEQRFDAGLLYRLKQATLTVPPLRSRPEDVMPLAEAMLADWATRSDRRVQGFSPDAASAMKIYGWPGNLRELSAVVAHAFALGGGAEIGLEDLPEPLRARPSARAPQSDEADLAQRVRWALVRCDGRVGEAADMLGMSRSSFWRLRRKLRV